MGIKRKAEEKKMNMNKNIARLAVTAGLTAALSFGGVMAPVTMAFAAGTPVATTSGNVTINEDTYKDTNFKGIQIFKAKVTQDQKSEGVWDSAAKKTLSDITWASSDAETAVKGVFADATDKPAVTATAQDWAEYIKKKAGDNVGENVKVDADSVLDKIAKALEGVTATNETTEWKTSTDGKFNNLPAGYWLFVTAQPGSTKVTDKTNGNEDAYTSPIFTIVGGAAVNAEPKKDVPNVTKAVKDDKDDKWVTDDSKTVFQAANKAADSAAGQPVEYQLAGTVASNINTYVTYSYTFTDELPLTMVPELGNDNKPVVKVKINDSIVSPDSYTVSYNTADGKNTLSVSFDNLKKAKDSSNNAITVNGDSKVYVNYRAKLDPNKITADMLGIAQENRVKLTYSNNPHANDAGTDTGTTVDHPAYDYTYGIDVTKVGSDAETKGLEGVEFTLQEKNGDNVEEKYIDPKGVKHEKTDKVTLKTDENGMINVIGLDEGTYILKEVKPAPSYNNSAASGVTFTIKRDLNQTGGNVTPSTNSVIQAADGVVKDNTATASIGKLSFTIVDQKGSGLPLTGLNGVTFTWIAGGAVLCIGVAHLIRSRKQAEESEQE